MVSAINIHLDNYVTGPLERLKLKTYGGQVQKLTLRLFGSREQERFG